MKIKVLPIFLILIIGTIGIFSFLGLRSAHNNGHHICPAFTMSGVACPPFSNVLALTAHHLSGLQFLKNFIVNFNPILLSFSLLLFFISSAFLKLLQKNYLGNKFLFSRHYVVEKSEFKTDRNFLRWLSRLKKRDPEISL